MLVLILLLHSFFLWQEKAFAESVQSLQSLAKVAEAFAKDRAKDINGEVRAQVLSLDSRLRLPACHMPLAPFLPFGQKETIGMVTVGIRCDDPQWSLYVPVKVDAFAAVVQTARPVNRGMIITANDVKLVKTNIASLKQGYFQSLDEVLGRQTRRSLNAGEVILPQLIRDQVLVQRGAEVMLVAVVGGAEVRTKGQALAEGQKGDVIEVLNKKSKRVVQGMVIAQNIVQTLKTP